MKNFIVFIITVFLGLFFAVFLKNNRDAQKDTRPLVKIFAASSFIAQWGPGPILKEKFEQTCDCRLDFYDSADSAIMIQRVKSEGSSGGTDVVLGLDQYDLEMAQGIEWRPLTFSKDLDFYGPVKATLNRSSLIPYDWGILSFVFRKSKVSNIPKSLDELLLPEFKGQIALEDPRTSSPGLQFLLWMVQVKGEEGAFSFIKKLNKQLHSYSPSWSSAYGLFQKSQVLSAFSYVTSPIYHQVEEKNNDVMAADFVEGHPLQFEYVGIPAQCKNCELAEKFVSFLLSAEGQKIVMEKNYMFPSIKGVREGTLFSQLPNYKIVDSMVLPKVEDRERLLKRWSALRREE